MNIEENKVNEDMADEESGEMPKIEADEDDDNTENDDEELNDEELKEEAEGDLKEKKVSVGKTCLPGIVYLGHIPPRLRPKNMRSMLSLYGEIGRIFLQPEGKTALTLHVKINPDTLMGFLCFVSIITMIPVVLRPVCEEEEKESWHQGMQFH